MERDLVSRLHDRRGLIRPTLDLLSDEEERGLRAGRGQGFEHGRSALRMRAVVEGQGHADGPRKPERNPERLGQKGHVSGRCGHAPGECGSDSR